MYAKLILDGEEIDRRRPLKGMTKSDLAKSAGLHLNSITAASKGRPVGVKVARAIAAGLGATLKAIVAEVKQENNVHKVACA